MKTRDTEYEYMENTESLLEENESYTLEDLIGFDNIADRLDEDTVARIATQVSEGYEKDKSSRQEREDRIRQAQNMALHITNEKTFPWNKAANTIYPLISSASMTFAARAYTAIMRDGRIAAGKVVGKEIPEPVYEMDQSGQPVQTGMRHPKKERADRIAAYMNYQLSEEIEGWERDTDRLLNALPVVGSMFRKIYFDPMTQKPAADIIYPLHLIVNNSCKGIKDAPRISEEIELYEHEIISNIRRKIFTDIDFGDSTDKDTDLSENDEMESHSEAHLIIEQHCRLDLDDDGYPEPYIVTLHSQTKKVLRVVANYLEDGIERNLKDEVICIKPESYYIKYDFMPAVDGSFYAIGFGEFLLPLNRTINSLLNQILDSGTLANTSMGFIGRGMRVKGGLTQFRPGEFKTVDTRGGNIRDNIFQMQHAQPSPVLFQLLGLLIESGKRFGGMADVLAGEQMSHQGSMGTIALIEEGLSQYKSIHKRIYLSLKEELKVLYRLNELYLDDQKYISVMDNEFAIRRTDFTDEGADVFPACEAHMVSDMQRITRAQFLEGYKGDPFIDQKALRERIFDSVGIEGEENLLIDPEPQPDAAAEAMMATAQAEQMKAQAALQKVEYESEIKRLEMLLEERKRDMDIEKQKADIVETRTRSIKNLAEAESKEPGNQIATHRQQLQTM